MNLFELFVKIEADDSQFKKSMDNAQKVSKTVAKAMKDLETSLEKIQKVFTAIAHPVKTMKSQFDKLKSATEALRHPFETFKKKVNDATTALETKRNKLSTLNASYEAAKNKVADLTKEFNKSAKESGTASKKTQLLARKLDEAEREAEDAKKELEDYAKSVSKVKTNLEPAIQAVGRFASKIGGGIKSAVKIGTKAVTGLIAIASGAIVALTKQAVESYAEYEQLVGGAELMFGDAFGYVQQKSQEAYKNVQMSQNEYLQQVNGFATGLKTALGGNEQAAAELADKIITAEADIVAATGNTQENVQNAFNGIMKSNFTINNLMSVA